MQSLFFAALLAVHIGPIDGTSPREPQMAAAGSIVGLAFGVVDENHLLRQVSRCRRDIFDAGQK